MPTPQLTEMQQLAEKSPERLVPFQEGDVVEARVISVNKHKVLVDVAGVALGMVPEREFSYDVDDLNVGDKVTGYVLLSENREGFVILSLKRADKERVWTTLVEKQLSGDPVKVKVASANRGGLLVEFGGVEGFIPVSQLSSQHYPKDGQSDPSKIVGKLRDMIGETIHAKVITIDKTNNKLIFSEKSVDDGENDKIINKIDVGTKLTGTVSGIVDFGLFIKIQVPNEDSSIEGLVHISEISWDRVENLHDLFKQGQEIEVMVISNHNGRLSFSIKRLTQDPWSSAKDKFKVGDIVEGEVSRVTLFGAFVKLEGNLDGLVHISELGDNITDPKQAVEEHKTYKFRVLSVEPEAHKISLSLKLKDDGKSKAKKTSSKKETEESVAPAVEKTEKETKAKKTTTKAKSELKPKKETKKKEKAEK
jgi:small subunit ribosomal protein S1